MLRSIKVRLEHQPLRFKHIDWSIEKYALQVLLTNNFVKKAKLYKISVVKESVLFSS